ncbi:hypothetical protein [Arthrobacter sp. AFG20]|uniref:hypothetical protein n=1 Tax=Arthrobacter sp. AFG20 TaxID=1688671 RepID=UPI000C9E91C6|nr:hypothetical protein [Arthrobacter sp. AFG20]PNH84034.1 hypothetical protein CXZ05_10590 [Arthrobacter sp. AFG20]
MSQQPPVSAPAVPDLPAHQPGTPPGPRPGNSFFDFRLLWTGAAAAAAAYAAVYLFSLAAVLLSLAGIAASQGNPIPALGGAIAAEQAPDAWSQLGQLTAQLVAMAHLGSAGTAVAGVVPFLGAVRGEGHLHAVPVAVLLISAVGIYLAGRLAELRFPSAGRPQLLLQSAVSGAVFALLVNGVAAAAAVRFPPGGGFSVDPISAGGWSVLVAFLLAAGLSVLSRNAIYARRAPFAGASLLRGKLNLPLAAVAVHTAVFSVIAIPAAWITAAVSGGWAALLSGPLLMGNAGGYGLVAGHLGGLHVLSETTAIFGAQESRNEDQTIYGFGADAAGTDAAVAAWAALALALVCTVISGLCVLLRRGPVSNSDLRSWAPVPAGFLLLGLLLLPLLTVRADFDAPGLASGQYVLAPAWWSPAVFLAWGLLVEISARFLAPYLVPVLPARLQRVLRVLPARPQGSQPGAAGAPVPVTSGEGPAAAGPAAIGPAATPPAERQLTAKGRRRLLVSAAIVGAVAVLAVGSVVTVNAVKPGPDQPVKDYAQALVDGDARKALEILDPDVPNEERVLLTNEVLGAAANRIDGFSIISTRISGDSAQVRAELRQGGRKYEQTFALVKNQPELVDDHWKLEAFPLQQVNASVDVPLAAVSVNGVTVPAGQNEVTAFGTNISLPAFPGSYSVGLPDSEKYLSVEDQQVVVSGGSLPQAPETARLTVKASDALVAETSRQVAAALAACEKSTDIEPEGCPFSRFAFGDVRNVKWSITADPDYGLSRSFDGTWRLSGGKAGEATVSYERNTSFSKTDPEWEKETDQMQFYVRGNVSVDSDKVLVSLSRF